MLQILRDYPIVSGVVRVCQPVEDLWKLCENQSRVVSSHKKAPNFVGAEAKMSLLPDDLGAHLNMPGAARTNDGVRSKYVGGELGYSHRT